MCFQRGSAKRLNLLLFIENSTEAVLVHGMVAILTILLDIKFHQSLGGLRNKFKVVYCSRSYSSCRNTPLYIDNLCTKPEVYEDFSVYYCSLKPGGSGYMKKSFKNVRMSF